MAAAAVVAWLVCGQASLARRAAAGAAFGGVTNVKEVVNRTPRVVRVVKIEPNQFETTRLETTKDIPPHGVWTGNMWVPWADNGDQFKRAHMKIVVAVPSPGKPAYVDHFYIWQSGEYVRFNDFFQFVDNAPRVPGESQAGGERRMIISQKGDAFVFKFEKFEP